MKKAIFVLLVLLAALVKIAMSQEIPTKPAPPAAATPADVKLNEHDALLVSSAEAARAEASEDLLLAQRKFEAEQAQRNKRLQAAAAKLEEVIADAKKRNGCSEINLDDTHNLVCKPIPKEEEKKKP